MERLATGTLAGRFGSGSGSGGCVYPQGPNREVGHDKTIWYRPGSSVVCCLRKGNRVVKFKPSFFVG
jgi:hypothetical protein